MRDGRLYQTVPLTQKKLSVLGQKTAENTLIIECNDSWDKEALRKGYGKCAPLKAQQEKLSLTRKEVKRSAEAQEKSEEAKINAISALLDTTSPNLLSSIDNQHLTPEERINEENLKNLRLHYIKRLGDCRTYLESTAKLPHWLRFPILFDK
jgi:hypothetical protein